MRSTSGSLVETEFTTAKVSVPEMQSRWKSWAADLFSFPVMCMSLLLVVVFRACLKGIGESDIWWHLLNARHLLQYSSFPSVDTYSFTAAGSPWLNHEWLSEIPFLCGFSVMGLQGILVVYFAVLGLIYAGTYYRACGAGADCKNAAVATLIGIQFGGVSSGPRMLLFGWLCMVGLLLVLDRFQRHKTGLWLLPPLFAVWINLHGSWVFGLVVLTLTIVCGLFEGRWGAVVAHRWSSGELKKLVVALAASLVALFANPFGYKLVLYPFELLSRQQSITRHLEEWQPVDFAADNGKLALFMIFALLAAALFSRRRWKLAEVTMVAFALLTSLIHVRFLFFAALVMVPILAPRLKLFSPYDRERDKPWLNAGIIAAVVATLIFFLPSSAKLQHQIDKEYPSAALEFMERQHINGRIFNSYAWGGYMEWKTPQLKPFIDGRADLFAYNGTFDEYTEATTIRKSLEIMDKHGIEFVLLEPRQPLTYVLDHSLAWRLIYSDRVANLYART